MTSVDTSLISQINSSFPGAISCFVKKHWGRVCLWERGGVWKIRHEPRIYDSCLREDTYHRREVREEESM